MTAGSWTFTNSARKYLVTGVIDLASSDFKTALYTSSTNLAASSDEYSGVTNQVASTGLGYTEGGVSVTFVLTGTTLLTADISTDPTYVASVGNITAKYALIYSPTSSKNLCYCLMDSTSVDVTASSGITLVIQTSSSGLFTLS